MSSKYYFTEESLGTLVQQTKNKIADSFSGCVKFNDLENNLSNGVNTVAGGTKSSAGVAITKITDLSTISIRLWWPSDSALVDDGLDDNNKNIHYYKREGCIVLFDSGITDGYYLQRFRSSVLRNTDGTSKLTEAGVTSERDKNNATQITFMGTFEPVGNVLHALRDVTVSLSAAAWAGVEEESSQSMNTLDGINYKTYNMTPLAQFKHPDETTLYYISNASKTTNTEIKSAVAVGTSCMSCNNNSAVFGNSCLSFGQANFVAGSINVVDNYFGAAFGVRNQVFGMAGFAEGGENYLGAAANRAHIEGSQGFAYGPGCHVEGTGNTVEKTSNAGHAEGNRTTVIGSYAHAQNLYTVARGNSSHAGGEHTEAKHTGSFTHGLNLVTGKNYQTVVGQNNVENANAFFVVGVGSTIDNKKNAFVVTDSGAQVTGTLTSTNISGTSLAISNIKAPTDTGWLEFTGNVGAKKSFNISGSSAKFTVEGAASATFNGRTYFNGWVDVNSSSQLRFVDASNNSVYLDYARVKKLLDLSNSITDVGNTTF